MNTRDYIHKLQELKDKNQNQEEMYPVSLRGMYQGVLEGLSFFDEFSNDEELDMDLVVKKRIGSARECHIAGFFVKKLNLEMRSQI